MNVLEDLTKCYGCTACYNICPVNAISMQPDTRGFLIPSVDDDTCIDCGACKRVCPAIEQDYSNGDVKSAYAFAADQETLSKSSSGGAFSLLAEHVLRKGGYVVGAAYDDRFMVRHVVISDVEELDALRRSKYVQSNQGDCYSQVKSLLAAGKTVLYTGTPCQIAGLKGFLGRSYDSLVTVDLLCHGVPSPKIYEEYLDNNFNREDIESIEMRRGDGWATCFDVKLKNGDIVRKRGRKDIFIDAFLSNAILRSTCYNCLFSRLPRQGDITIGDFWGAGKLGYDEYYRKKSSIVLLNSAGGERLWDASLKLAKRNVHAKKVKDVNTLESSNGNIFRPIVTSTRRQRRFDKLHKRLPFEEAATRTLHHFDVGLVVFMANNFGSAATNIALYKAIEKLGYSAIVLDTLAKPSGTSNYYVKNFMNASSKFSETGDYKWADRACDTFMIGSDQCWRWSFGRFRESAEYFLLDFTSETKRRVAYAPSFGAEQYAIDKDMQDLFKHSLKRFHALSVREDYAVNMCKKLFDADAVQVVDPVFLLDKSDYLEIAAQSSVKHHEPYLLAYILEPTANKRKLIYKLGKRMNLKVVVICDAKGYERKRALLDMPEIIDKPEMPDWFSYFAHAEYVITDSFHGTCFSLIFEKNFVAIKRGAAPRFDSLLRMFDVNETDGRPIIVDSVAKAVRAVEDAGPRDYSAIGKQLDEIRSVSVDWLKSALEVKVRPVREDHRDLMMAFARTVKTKTEYDLTSSYQYLDALRTQRASLVSEGSSYLEAVARSYGMEEPPSRDFQAIEDLRGYFEALGDLSNYTVFLSCKDDCGAFWDRFVERSGLPLKVHPKDRMSYAAVVHCGKTLYEFASVDPIDKFFTLYTSLWMRPEKKLGKRARISTLRYAIRQMRYDFSKFRRPHFTAYPVMGHIHSMRNDKVSRVQKSIIAINNVDYSVDGNGINVVVMETDKARVVDSFYIDLRTDPHTRIRRDCPDK